MSSFAKDLIVAIAVTVSVTIAVSIVVCVAAHCGPRLCGMSRKERWFAADVEQAAPPGGELPLMTEKNQWAGNDR
ncbi:hypothetical protein SAMD00023353_10100090 [Rosellinia necatrix]|uniref:Uncharacterized protein n=1 Tax=Rosellinia necatrix TaxID=77044 RepID=A0A1S8AAZ9_ROSNE|nr:hypothetical protein SAMD00023353_10100090 [Rosellinia necatrix]